MDDWNVVATSRIGRFDDARELLGMLGPIYRTGLYKVRVMRCDELERYPCLGLD